VNYTKLATTICVNTTQAADVSQRLSMPTRQGLGNFTLRTEANQWLQQLPLRSPTFLAPGSLSYKAPCLQQAKLANWRVRLHEVDIMNTVGLMAMKLYTGRDL